MAKRRCRPRKRRMSRRHPPVGIPGGAGFPLRFPFDHHPFALPQTPPPAPRIPTVPQIGTNLTRLHRIFFWPSPPRDLSACRHRQGFEGKSNDFPSPSGVPAIPVWRFRCTSSGPPAMRRDARVGPQEGEGEIVAHPRSSVGLNGPSNTQRTVLGATTLIMAISFRAPLLPSCPSCTPPSGSRGGPVQSRSGSRRSTPGSLPARTGCRRRPDFRTRSTIHSNARSAIPIGRIQSGFAPDPDGLARWQTLFPPPR